MELVRTLEALSDQVGTPDPNLPTFIKPCLQAGYTLDELLQSARKMTAEYVPVLDFIREQRDSIPHTVKNIQDLLLCLVEILDKDAKTLKPPYPEGRLHNVLEAPDDLVHQIWIGKKHGDWMIWPGVKNLESGAVWRVVNIRSRITRVRSMEEQTDKALLTSKLFRDLTLEVPYLSTLVDRSGYFVYRVLHALKEMEEMMHVTLQKPLEAPIRTRSMHRKLAGSYTSSVLNRLIGYNSLYGQRMRRTPRENRQLRKRAWAQCQVGPGNVLFKGDELLLPLYALKQTDDTEKAMTTIHVERMICVGSKHDGVYCVRMENKLYFMKVLVGQTPQDRKQTLHILQRVVNIQRDGQLYGGEHLPQIVDGVDLLLLEDVPISFRFYEWVDGIFLSAALREKRVPSKQKTRWFFQAAAGLYALHRENLLHKSLHGKSILVRRSNQEAVLVDLDSCVDISRTVPAYRQRMFRREVLALVRLFDIEVPDHILQRTFPLWSFISVEKRADPPLFEGIDWVEMNHFLEYPPSTPPPEEGQNDQVCSPELHPRSEDDENSEQDPLSQQQPVEPADACWDIFQDEDFFGYDSKRSCLMSPIPSSVWEEF